MQHEHTTGPMSASAVSPKSPWDFGEFGMAGLLPEIDEGLSKSGTGTVAWIAPKLTVSVLGLLVGRSHEGAVVFPGKSLPMQVIGSGKT